MTPQEAFEQHITALWPDTESISLTDDGAVALNRRGINMRYLHDVTIAWPPGVTQWPPACQHDLQNPNHTMDVLDARNAVCKSCGGIFQLELDEEPDESDINRWVEVRCAHIGKWQKRYLVAIVNHSCKFICNNVLGPDESPSGWKYARRIKT